MDSFSVRLAPYCCDASRLPPPPPRGPATSPAIRRARANALRIGTTPRATDTHAHTQARSKLGARTRYPPKRRSTPSLISLPVPPGRALEQGRYRSRKYNTQQSVRGGNDEGTSARAVRWTASAHAGRTPAFSVAAHRLLWAGARLRNESGRRKACWE